MSLSNQARNRRNVELHTGSSEITTLYHLLKTDQEIAKELHIDVATVKSTRDSMFLPPLRSASGRIFTPEMDTQVMDLRDRDGKMFKDIAATLGVPYGDVVVRYRILQRLQDQREAAKDRVTIKCMRCRQPFVSEDRIRIRFCLPCKSGPMATLDCGPFDL